MKTTVYNLARQAGASAAKSGKTRDFRTCSTCEQIINKMVQSDDAVYEHVEAVIEHFNLGFDDQQEKLVC